MPNKAWSAKRERQYEHVKDSPMAHGDAQTLAEEIAARVVKKERARHGESVRASSSSLNDNSSGRRGGLSSHSGAVGRTVMQLRNEARQDPRPLQICSRAWHSEILCPPRLCLTSQH
jgi:hypothetical protein